MATPYFCCDDRRRAEIAGRSDLNGIDFLEVLDEPSQPDAERQRTLFVHFINDPGGLALEAANVTIEGGDRIRDLTVRSAAIAVDPRAGTATPVLVVEVAVAGDFSPYVLRFVADPAHPDRLDRIDPVLREVSFSFKVACPTDFDCIPAASSCPPAAVTVPVHDYLARDFTSLRQLLLDRLAASTPSWSERNAADLGVALVELVAYAGDYLSYRQDAIGTEAYLGTARSRVSVRRHARLVDYPMHDGCSARVWAQVEVSDPTTLPAHTPLLTAVAGQPARIDPGSPAWTETLALQPIVFETLRPDALHPEHNLMRFHTWGQRQCCLPQGATCATLRGPLPQLRAGDVLVFQEVVNPATGSRADRAFERRHAVQLVEVTPGRDPIGGRFDDPPGDDPLDIVEIRWADADRLPFALCLSAEADERYGGGYLPDVSVALGNVVLADHGQSVVEDLGETMPASTRLRLKAVRSDDPFEAVPVRFRPVLARQPLSQTVKDDPDQPPQSATGALLVPPRSAVPDIDLSGTVDARTSTWSARRDLLASLPDDPHFVVEVENDGGARLRFGDGGHGAIPAAGMQFTARYRVGNGASGNIGGGALAHIVTGDPAVLGVTNPLAARGGLEPETIAEVRERAPHAFRVQARAVTPDDYAARAGTAPGVQRAAATARWTGSWRTMFVSVDRSGNAALDPGFAGGLRQYIEPFRLAGHDVEIEGPRFVPLDIALRIQVRPEYLRSDVLAALVEVFGSGRRPDGRLAMFHPDNLTFGQTLYVSPLYEAAASIEGVACVEVTTFERRDAPDPGPLAEGRLTFGRLEVPRLDNDPNFPERGILRLEMEGGR